jgi:ParB/RepB/Spo0J family partition protein
MATSNKKPDATTKATPDFFAGLKDRAGGLQKLAATTSKPAPGNEGEKIENLPINMILPNPDQPRRILSEQDDNELMEDIRERGVLQPIIVCPAGGKPGRYVLVAGQRRLRASGMAGNVTIPAIVRNYTELEARTVAAIENLQRKDLDEVDEARYFQFLSKTYNLSNRQIAKLIHKSPSYVDQRMRLLQTNERVKNTQTLQNSQLPVEEANPQEPAKTAKINLTSFRKFGESIDITLEALTATPKGSKPDNKVVAQVRDNVREVKEKLALLEKALKDLE